MTRAEFDDWLDKHTAHFPGVATWLGKFSDPQSDAILGVWFQHLAACELADCLAATETLFGQGRRAPVYERHPQAIRAIIRERDVARLREEQPPRYVDGEQVFDCPLCQDSGMVRCWHPRTVAAAENGTLGEPFTVYACAVICSCEAGDRTGRQPRYTPERWALVGDCGWRTTAQIRDDCWELLEALEAKRPAQPAEKQETMF